MNRAPLSGLPSAPLPALLLLPPFWMLAACASPDLGPPPPLDWVPADTPPPEVQTEPGRYPLDLPGVLRLAGSRPLALQAAQARAEAAAAAENEAIASWLPTLRPRIAFNRTEGLVQNSPGMLIPDVERQNAFAGGGIDVDFNLADAWYSTLAAAQRTRAAALGIRDQQQINTLQAVHLYYGLVEAAAALEISDRAVAHANELVDVEEARLAQGVALRADLLRAQAHLAAMEGRRADFVAEGAQRRAELGALLVLPDGVDLVPVEEKIVPIRFPEADTPLPELLERAHAQRPDLSAARALAEAAEVEESRASRQWMMPRVQLGASYGAFGDNLGSSAEEREDYFALVQWEVGLGPFARQAAATARRREAEINVVALKNELRARLQTAHARIAATRLRMEAAERGVTAAEEARSLVRARHEQGEALQVEVLEAERSATEVEIELVRAVSMHNRAQFELRRLVGG